MNYFTDRNHSLVFTRVALGLCLVFDAAAATPLPALNIDKSQTTISGASSGGYMAVQLHVAYSARFSKGAGVIAGGPYNCAEGGVLNALTRCLGSAPIPVPTLVATTQSWAKEGLIDPTTHLAQSKVYIFSGANDSVVKEGTSTALAAYYANFLPATNVVHKRDIPSEHSFVTDEFGSTCQTKATPFINNCGFDLAGAMLKHFYADLQPRQSGAPLGKLIEFDQTPFAKGHGMGASGYAFVPTACAGGALCRVHIALHGCRQNNTDVGDAFARGAGFNRWADTNNLVVLYPQTGKGATNSCWDWWGYDDANYAKKSAPQMQAIVAMLDQLTSGTAKNAAAPSPTPAR